MTQEEATEPLAVLRRNESEVPPVNARKLVAVYLAVLEGSPFMTVAQMVQKIDHLKSETTFARAYCS